MASIIGQVRKEILQLCIWQWEAKVSIFKVYHCLIYSSFCFLNFRRCNIWHGTHWIRFMSDNHMFWYLWDTQQYSILWFDVYTYTHTHNCWTFLPWMGCSGKYIHISSKLKYILFYVILRSHLITLLVHKSSFWHFLQNIFFLFTLAKWDLLIVQLHHGQMHWEQYNWNNSIWMSTPWEHHLYQ